jgi:membrane protein YqaA with SNARE-associated domain
MPSRIAIGLALFTARSDAVWKWLHRLGGPGLLLLGIADNLPVASSPAGSVDMFLIALSAHQPHWWAYYALMATAGEVLGGYLTYQLSEKGGQQTFEKKIRKDRAEKLYKVFKKHGFVTVFAGAIFPPPFPFTPVLMAAGVMQYPRKKFISALAAGRAVRFFIAAYLARTYSQQMIKFFSRFYHPVIYALILLAVNAGVGAAIYVIWYRPKVQREERERGEEVQDFPIPGRREVENKWMLNRHRKN